VSDGASELVNLWKLITSDLVRARCTLPDGAQEHIAIREFHEFLDHNEFELACDMLETYAETHPVTRDFWLALRDAATKMELSERARKFESLSLIR
jgi:hypothetical protein